MIGTLLASDLMSRLPIPKEVLMLKLARAALPIAVLTALFSLTACTSPSAAPSASPSPATQLGPDGYGDLTLGMSKNEARATGLATQISQDATGGCGDDTDGWLKAAPTPTQQSMAGRLFFSTNSDKLVAIYAYGDIATPEGLHLGSTAADVRTDYPTWTGNEKVDGVGTIPVPGSDSAEYRVDIEDGAVVTLSLDATDQDCYE